MRTRSSIQKHIAQTGEKVSRWRTWAEVEERQATPLLRENLPSGYSNWFAVVKDQSIWWIYTDTSDGGVWSSEGMAVTGFRIAFDASLAQNIYELVYERLASE
ncbi:hypothetical protein LOY35_16710 [Pseudomonas sp. B21-028]|uniref:hypothetical protein n=1 Tax=Pseudomonas sp. B21-028 TaxID=2895480 RepID=UPI00215EAD72|nr:hypothetical protein [Pseudomonas sp. B21-028]UVL81870.1 hypothetical protein LOY35_16710 [Pseudomonas sp. B21-028]